ncbi:YdcF family protein [Bacillus suaedaesalsae]|uniref:YdcF family protein n=1 Tax=Bacillus suaedaesalsae TaxID=2810349 RepID=A0ABS2DHL8_9BACI|nr:YdcF family protein [Bacillus suaedaesalsae]MBM6617972.1 YdcF family protein [Bacillus suaedaesalsae]
MKKLIKLFLSVIIIVIGLYTVTVHTLIAKTAKEVPPDDADYVIVLGARLHGEEMSLSLLYRVEAALDYLNTNPSTKVIVSGGQGPGEDITEAEAMLRFFKEKGIPEERILLEDKSTTTYENLSYSKNLIEDSTTVIIVSNDFHLFRSTIIADRVGLEQVYTLSAKTPTVVILKLWVREYAAVLKTWLVDR